MKYFILEMHAAQDMAILQRQTYEMVMNSKFKFTDLAEKVDHEVQFIESGLKNSTLPPKIYFDVVVELDKMFTELYEEMQKVEQNE